VEKFYKTDDPVLLEIKAQVVKLNPKFNDIELYEGDKSYTINKKKVYICLKDKNNRYYQRNMLMYVVLHELAHVICKSVGHTEEFNQLFQDLLAQASEAGIYNPSIPPLSEYCGHS
jgi:hypothetical protein